MNIEQSIALRYLISKRRITFVTAISFISIIGVMVGVAALVVVLSVFNGFNGLVTSILVGFDPHLRIEGKELRERDSYESLTKELQTLPMVQGYAPFVMGKALVVSRSVNRVINVKGMDEATIDAVSGLRGTMVLGELSFRGAKGNGMVIGLTLADRLGVVSGDTVSVVSPAGSEPALLQRGQPLIRRFVITGIYESNNKEYDALYSFVSLTAGQELFELNGKIHGLEVRLSDLDETNDVASELTERYGASFRILTWYDLHRELYSVMEIERWMAYVILCLIIGVASFNLLGSLTISVIEKTRDIGILKAMGANRGLVQRIFMYQGLLVGILGSIGGLVLGIVIVILQKEFHLVPLDPTVYIIPAIPVEIRVMDIVLVPLTAIGLSSLAALYPSRRAGSLIPVEAIRWE
ncbi:MAG: FtsX-like permease family protein [Bacteroidota bacterium]